MWCQQCGQDVPAPSASGGLPSGCPRCAGSVASTANVATAEQQNDQQSPCAQWKSDERMKQIGRSLRTPLTITNRTQGESTVHWLDVVAMNHAVEPPRTTTQVKPAVRAKPAIDRRMQWFAWFALSVGLGLAAGGITLMGWGLFGEDVAYWQWGVGIALAGQAILIAGLVRVLTSLWNSSRAASRRLHDMQHELAEVGRTAEAIIAQRPGSASGFYGELARGASPALLLANLKGQIDHLATRLHQDV